MPPGGHDVDYDNPDRRRPQPLDVARQFIVQMNKGRNGQHIEERSQDEPYMTIVLDCAGLEARLEIAPFRDDQRDAELLPDGGNIQTTNRASSRLLMSSARKTR